MSIKSNGGECYKPSEMMYINFRCEQSYENGH